MLQITAAAAMTGACCIGLFIVVQMGWCEMKLSRQPPHRANHWGKNMPLPVDEMMQNPPVSEIAGPSDGDDPVCNQDPDDIDHPAPLFEVLRKSQELAVSQHGPLKDIAHAMASDPEDERSGGTNASDDFHDSAIVE